MEALVVTRNYQVVSDRGDSKFRAPVAGPSSSDRGTSVIKHREQGRRKERGGSKQITICLHRASLG